ncbi:carbohydrate hydrolase [Tractidigestivibacter scatoligenes]|uniref:Carbohydrate hydrolase n=1 Tax=Tractidigestivibacter scatoligenes TaxID=1299998 RepID=A0A100YXJ4_TRASO|nr:UxaA family hydrolase [Tractidigestivibacter scatoligenes]KUH59527.1 carbohydrate hydrolase [Tractidigestivibacter scatoligenes]
MMGYVRPDGRYGVRNYVLVLSSVGCANHVADLIAKGIPGAVSLRNAKGCGQLGKSAEMMSRCLVNLSQNPNVFGTVVVGLGCETMRPHELAQRMRSLSDKPVYDITIQEEGGSSAAVEKGRTLVKELVERAEKVTPSEMGLGDLVLGTNCGGSDATSGIAANPTIGYVSDAVVGAGGTVFLGETTELIGTEHILARRAASPKVRDDILRLVGTLENDLVASGVDVRGANPSPGNMRGGLSTLEEKALGGISKGGTSKIQQVIEYGARPSRKGLIIMDTPGYDIESVSGMVAGGAQVVIFSSGRGTPTGCALAPVIKVTGNDETFSSMGENIDFDASGVITQGESVHDEGKRLLELLERVCSGEQAASERLGFDDFSLYHNMELWGTCSFS